MVTRRSLIGGMSAAFASAAVGKASLGGLPEIVTMDSPATRPPLEPPNGRPYLPVATLNGWTLPWRMREGVKEFHLVAEPVEREIAPGMRAHLWGYNGQSPGPTIEVVDGDRVRYFSIDQRDWEEIPASLVDWDATKKIATDEQARKAALIAKVHAAEVARRADAMDIDASIEIAPKVFLPSGDGLFEFDGKAIYPLTQAEADMKFSKTQMLKQVLIPVPVVPTRHTISLRGTRAKFRLKSAQTEFYMRTADGREPQLDLIRAKVHGDKRDLENLDELFKEQAATGKISIPIQRWEIAHGVYRFTLGAALEPGEYAMAEVVQGGATSLYFWDFGVDANTAPPASNKPK